MGAQVRSILTAGTTAVTAIIQGGTPKHQVVPRVSRELAGWFHDQYLHGEGDREAFIASALAAHDKTRRESSAAGSTLHRVARELVGGREPKYPLHLAGHVAGLRRVVEEFEVAPVHQECTVVSNRYDYNGKFDLIGCSPYLLGGAPFILDWKASASVDGDTALQNAAYALADFMVHPRTGRKEGVPYVEGSFVAHVTADGTTIHPLAENRSELEEHFALFVEARALHLSTGARREALKPPVMTPDEMRLLEELAAATDEVRMLEEPAA